MNEKMSKRQRDLKAKLMAAISMLLVSSIMMVSTTYAWFTLSTAPEVTGITTAVGANGNLEMALLPYNVDLSKLDDATVITSAVGDSRDASGQTIAESNVTWGNLVDLKDTTVYGLDEISLMPAALHLEDDGTIGNNPLDRPAYGVDGRVTELKNDVLTGIYASNAFYQNDSAYGVRGVGTSSSMSPRQLAHRALVQDGSKKTTLAKSTASNSLATYGADLAGLAIKKVNNSNATYTRDEVKMLYTVVGELDAALDNVETVLKSYAAANAIAPADSESSYTTLQTNVLNMTLDQIASSGYATTTFSTAKTKLQTTQSNVDAAIDGLKALLYTKDGDGNYTATETDTQSFGWSDISSSLTKILDIDKMELNGYAMSVVKETETVDGETKYKNIGVIAKAVIADGIQLSMPNGSGAYADLAEFCGDYATIIYLPEGLEIESIPLGGMEAQMKTACIGSGTDQLATPYLTSVSNEKATFVAADGGSSANAITEFYGYIIDLAFRTNVADSKLLLQTAAQNRIYSNNTENAEIMGAGSTMTFTGADGFNAVSVKNLMEHLRIVFFETGGQAVLAYARLDTENAEIEGNTVTAEMYLYDGTDLIKDSTDAEITELEQNTAKAVSVLVYLDGTSITNADVANASDSMTGSMNLQFASSANLVPMDYSDLKQGNNGTGSSTTYSDLSAVTVATAAQDAGVELLKGYLVDKGGEKGIGVILDGVPTGYDVYLSVNNADPVKASKGSYSGFSGYGITVDSAVTTSTAITVSIQQSESDDPVVIQYSVTFTGAEGVTSNVQADQKVNAGDSVSITVTNSTGTVYNVLHNDTSLGTVAAKADETDGTATFTISNVQADVAISVSAQQETN